MRLSHNPVNEKIAHLAEPSYEIVLHLSYRWSGEGVMTLIGGESADERLGYAEDLAGLDVPDHSKRTIVEAGKVIAARLAWTRENEALLIPAFQTAHDWRVAHTIPMRRIRRELSAATRALAGAPVTAGRLKRMQSIRKKLQRTPLTLYQIQDIAGCRAIVEDMAGVDALVAHFKACRHTVQREDDYVSSPKRGGYRSRHLVLKFSGLGNEERFNRQTVEVQFRTRAQHAWATAVEAVGLVRNEDLKAGRGDPRWLRLFALMSGEFAAAEGTSPVPDVGEAATRLAELAALEVELDAIRTMESYNNAIASIDGMSGSRGMSFLIRYDNATKTVAVKQWSKFARLAEAYLNEDISGGNAVLVEVDQIEDLKTAYPNYFLDVALFVERMKASLGAPAPAAKGRRIIDLSWWYRDES